MYQAIVIISEGQRPLAETIAKETGADILHINDVSPRWHDYNAFVFISALGICVRTIAPLIADKHADPAVVCVDTCGKHAIAVVSGHVGGANELTKIIAHIIGAEAVITTQSDLSGLWALDTLAARFGWEMDETHINNQISLFVAGCPTALLLEVRDKGTDWLEANLPQHVSVFYHSDDIPVDEFKLIIVVGPVKPETNLPAVWYSPRCLHAGIGLAHQAPVETLDEIRHCLHENGVMEKAIAAWHTIDVKADEPAVIKLQEEGYSVELHTADRLSTKDVPTPSKVVERHVGTKSVCEAAAMIGAGTDSLLLNKQKGAQWTLAVAMESTFERRGHVEIVGAGPGDPDLVSVRGRRFLETADLILYAGSLVPRELTLCAKDGAVVRSSASMALEEQCELMKSFTDRGLLVVRLHTGDPCIFGAIQEQMAFFDLHDISYHITPGISSFLAAAAELRSQFTIPERCQTIILTRGEGRTPMPDKEKLHLLARSQSTMCIFLSASIVDDVQRQLLEEYPPHTPVAACYHLTWPDQHIYRGTLDHLADIVKGNNLTLTTMIVVGEAIDNRHGLSELYSSHFTHLFRKATE